jgi:ParB/RepB/Spo0J family partition protein
MIVRVPLDRIEDNPYQPRTVYSDVGDLVEGIRKLAPARPETSGLIHPPLGRLIQGDRVLAPGTLEEHPEARVQLAAGHRRLRAFRALAKDGDQWSTLPVELARLDDEAMADVAWEENVDREDISPIEEAEALERAIEAFGYTQAQIGARRNLSQAAVSNKLRLLALPEPVKEELRHQRITERHGRALLPLLALGVGAQQLLRLLRKGRDGFHTVAELEERIQDHIEEHTRPTEAAVWAAVGLTWAPDHPQAAEEGVRGPCEGCSQLVGRKRICTDLACYEAKERWYRILVAGPAAAIKIHNENRAHMVLGTPKYDWARCGACGRKRQQVSAEQRDRPWYKVRNRLTYICPECIERAQLPEPAPPGTSRPEEIASAPAVLTPERAEEAPRPLSMRPASASTPTPAPAPAPRPKPKPEPSEPPPPPATLITVRIIPPSEDGQDLDQRLVMVAIAEEGTAPSDFRAGKYFQLTDIIQQISRRYFESISREITPQEA